MPCLACAVPSASRWQGAHPAHVTDRFQVSAAPTRPAGLPLLNKLQGQGELRLRGELILFLFPEHSIRTLRRFSIICSLVLFSLQSCSIPRPPWYLLEPVQPVFAPAGRRSVQDKASPGQRLSLPPRRAQSRARLCHRAGPPQAEEQLRHQSASDPPSTLARRRT